MTAGATAGTQDINTDDLATFAAFAGRLAEASGEVIRRYFRRDVAIDTKPDATPVTIADREAEAAMRALIEQRYPDHGIFGEEHGAVRTDAEWVWVLDPVDGTKAFACGKPNFGTLIALAHRGTPVVGVIDQPISGERWLGVDGRPTTLNGQPIRTRPCCRLAEAWLGATNPEMFAGDDLAPYQRLRQTVYTAHFGGECYAYGLLAAGHMDLILEADMQPYDYCALVPVVAGAGGRITDWQGGPLGLNGGGRTLAAGDPALHAAALDVLASAT